MSHSALEILEKKQDYPVLIVDKEGFIGEGVSKELKNNALVVFVSQNPPEASDNIIHIPYSNKFPTIPDNLYSYLFLIDEKAQLTKEILSPFVKKAEKDNAVLILVLNLAHITQALLDTALSSYRNIKVVITGDIFATDYIYDGETEVNKFIIQAKTKGRIVIEGDGTTETAPVFIEDVIGGLMEIVFGGHGKEQLFYLFPKHKVTQLSLFRMFQKQDPTLHIDFVKASKIRQDNFIPPKEGIFLLPDSYSPEDKIKKIDFGKLEVKNTEKAKPETKEDTNKISLVPVIFAFIFLLLLPLISTLLFSFIGAGALYAVKNSIGSNNLSMSKEDALFASNSFNIALLSSAVLTKEASYLGQLNSVNSLSDKINLGKNISSAAYSLVDASDKMKAVLTGKSSNPSSDFSDASNEIKYALFIYEKEKEAGVIPSSITKSLGDLTNITSSTIDFWPDIMGFNGEKTYLVLFENNMELRPGGGFIGSYGILTVDNGMVKGFKIYDVYDADGQLKSHVEPPYPIRRYLPSVNWYLRDSNFNVDFSKGAVASAVFLDTEMHQQVDGVIGVDLSFVKNLLSVIGPVNVVDYNQTVNSDNFFQIAQSHAQDNFFPGSTQKKDFLRSFYQSLELKLSSEKDLSYLNLLEVFSSSVYEKHVVFTFNNIDEQATFAVNGLTSSLIDERPNDNTEVNDFMGVDEANLGGNKVNYYVTRSFAQDVNVGTNGSINESLTIAFKNTAPQGAWTGSGYKNYLRVILPLNATVSGVQIDGKNQTIVPAITDPSIYEKKNFVPPTGLEVDKQNQGQNTVYGFLVMVGPQELKTIKVNYSLSQKLDLSNPDFIYSLDIFKQPGIDFYPYNFSLSVPDSLRFINYPADVKTEGTTATFSTQITRDRELTIDLAQQ